MTFSHFGKILPRQSHTYWEASIGVHGRNSGVCFSIGAKWLSDMINHGMLVPRRAMSIALLIGNTRLGNLNVYASTYV